MIEYKGMEWWGFVQLENFSLSVLVFNWVGFRLYKMYMYQWGRGVGEWSSANMWGVDYWGVFGLFLKAVMIA